MGLVGILCEVASQVARSAKEEVEKTYLETNLLGVLECYDSNDDRQIGIREFLLIMENPEVHETLTKFGTDPVGLASLRDRLFLEESSRITFTDLFEVIVRLRGGQNAHVTDIVELREYVKSTVLAKLAEVCMRQDGLITQIERLYS